MTKAVYVPKAITSEHGLTYIGGLNRVFHCNYYNGYLQTAVLLSEGAGDCQPRKLLYDAVIPLVHHLRAAGYSDAELIEEFAYCGFGKLRKMLDGKWATPNSHYGQAALLQGKPTQSCFFTAGYIAGLTGKIATELVCKQQGGAADWFATGEPQPPVDNYLVRPPQYATEPPRFGFPECRPFSTDLDEATIIETVQSLPLFGKSGMEDTGLIDAFGVVLTNHFADYYNRISYESYFGMLKAGMPEKQIREVLVQGGHICAFHTFGGIMCSPEWYSLIQPHCKDDADWLHGIIAVINALGWGTWRVEKIDPGHELIIRVYNSYEGVGFRRMYPKSAEVQMSFLVMGVVQGLAHLLWKIDIKQRPTLSQELYAKAFNNPEGRFGVTQTHAIAAGHEYDRVIARRE